MKIPTAKCPRCDKLVNKVYFEDVLAVMGSFDVAGIRSIAYLCPECRSVLSVQIDPIAIRSEIVKQVDQAVSPLVNEIAALRTQISTLAARL